MIDVFAMAAANRAGPPAGLPSFCTANEIVLRTLLDFARGHDLPVLIEATCNQVNQFGGYTGQRPEDFLTRLKSMARAAGLPQAALILGGDHLGPNPWKHLPAEEAMDHARELVRLFAAAGYTKLHLDASMALGGEAAPAPDLVARRAAELCRVAEAAAPDRDRLFYVIGTEVPVPGGETEAMDGIAVTTRDSVAETIATHQAAFGEAGLESAWNRVCSVVVQPGVDFNHSSVIAFDPEAASDLTQAILDIPRLTFEAHSTDYQPAGALAGLVEAHCLFLKVGPELTFRLREAVLALTGIERRMTPERPSDIEAALVRAMQANPEHWQAYYKGEARAVEQMMLFSLSDRIRYYWTDAQVKEALARLLANLEDARPPAGVLSQYLAGDPDSEAAFDAAEVLHRSVAGVARRYYAACGFPDA